MFDTKRALGQYSTPPLTVEYMIHLVKPYLREAPRCRILDPAVGDGVFLHALLEHGISGKSIYALDIDASVLSRLDDRAYLSHQDFLQFNDDKFDVILGNPPYKSKRQSEYIQNNRQQLEAQFKGIGFQNMYAMFMVHAIRNLREGGALCFIVQDSFLTNVYYRHFRSFILEHCKIKEITLAPRRLFHATNADVRTAIVLLEKCSGASNALARSLNQMKLVDRLQDESEYFSTPPNKVQQMPQQYFLESPLNLFSVNVPLRVLDIFQTSKMTLGDVMSGGTGISTGNDAKFLRTYEEIPACETADWVPFYKNGGVNDAWFYRTPLFIHRDWQTPSEEYKDFMTRNSEYYFREGITCSSMGASFSAAYLPPGCLFGVNANLFAESEEQLYYVLGFLNSPLAKYMVRAILNRTNMVTAGYIKRLPYIEPSPAMKSQVSTAAKRIVDGLMRNSPVDVHREQQAIDEAIFSIYDIDSEDEATIRLFCSNLVESM